MFVVAGVYGGGSISSGNSSGVKGVGGKLCVRLCMVELVAS